MPGGIWEAIGAALQSGAGTYNAVSQQQAEQRAAAERLRLQQEQELRQAAQEKRQAEFQAAQLAMQQKEFENSQKDRRINQLHMAIEGAAPDQDMSDYVSDIRADAPHLLSRLNIQPGAAHLNATPGLGAATGDNPLGLATGGEGATFKPASATRRATLAEQSQKSQLEVQKASLAKQKSDQEMAAKIMAQLESGQLKDTPRNRALLAQYTTVNPNEVWGSIEHPSRNTPTAGMPNTEGLIQTILSDPTGQVYRSLPAALKTKLAPALGNAGFRFQNNPGPSQYARERVDMMLESLDGLEPKVNAWTTGIGVVVGRMIPGTAATDFAAELKTLACNTAFEALTAMREASKTGGALGQVSDREGELLRDARAALDQDQSAENIRIQFARIRSSLERWKAAHNQQLQEEGQAGISIDPSRLGAAPTAPVKGATVGRFQITEVK